MIHAAVHNPTITHPTHLVTHPPTNPTITTPSTPLLPNHDQPTLLLPPDVVQPHFHGYQSAIFGACEKNGHLKCFDFNSDSVFVDWCDKRKSYSHLREPAKYCLTDFLH